MRDKITFYSIKDAEEFLLNDSLYVSYYFYAIIENIVVNELENDILFHIDMNNTIVDLRLDNSKLETPIEKCLKVFEIYEDYEKCSKCLELLKKIKDS